MHARLFSVLARLKLAKHDTLWDAMKLVLKNLASEKRI